MPIRRGSVVRVPPVGKRAIVLKRKGTDLTVCVVGNGLDGRYYNVRQVPRYKVGATGGVVKRIPTACTTRARSAGLSRASRKRRRR